MNDGMNSTPKLSYADWLDSDPANVTGVVAQIEHDKLWLEYADAIKEFSHVAGKQFASVLELGCGSGQLAQHLAAIMPGVAYTGVDKSRKMLRLSETRQYARESTLFIGADIITNPKLPDADLVCSFAVMKHFSLGQLPGVFKQACRWGEYGLHTFAIGQENVDDGQGFVHQWITDATLEELIKAAGHKIIWWKVRVQVDTNRADVYVGTQQKPVEPVAPVAPVAPVVAATNKAKKKV